MQLTPSLPLGRRFSLARERVLYWVFKNFCFHLMLGRSCRDWSASTLSHSLRLFWATPRYELRNAIAIGGTNEAKIQWRACPVSRTRPTSHYFDLLLNSSRLDFNNGALDFKSESASAPALFKLARERKYWLRLNFCSFVFREDDCW
jgi:hypothetical protein